MKDRKLRTLIYLIVILLGVVCYLIPSGLKMDTLIYYNLGISLTTSGIIALIFEIALKNEFIKNIKSEINSNLKTMGVGHDLSSYFKREFITAKKEIDIIAISFTLGINNLDREFLKKILKEHCRIRILIVDPESEFIKYRAFDEPDQSEKRIKDKINETIDYFRSLESKAKYEFIKDYPLGSIQVKTHKSIPYFGYTRYDEKCSYSPLLIGRYGNFTPVFEIDGSNTEIFNNLKFHFNNLWERQENRTIVNIDYGFMT
jgi:hypothetical protein